MEAAFAIVTLLVVVVAFANEYYQQKLGVSMMPTMPRVAREMVALAAGAPEGRIVELGSGWGGLARRAAKAFPGRAVVGIEYSLFPYLGSRLRGLLPPRLPNLRFDRRDFFAVPLDGAGAVLCYLSHPLMARLQPKFAAELPPGACVVSSTFPVPGWTPDVVRDVKGAWKTQIFVYKKGKVA